MGEIHVCCCSILWEIILECRAVFCPCALRHLLGVQYVGEVDFFLAVVHCGEIIEEWIRVFAPCALLNRVLLDTWNTILM